MEKSCFEVDFHERKGWFEVMTAGLLKHQVNTLSQNNKKDF